MPEVSAAGGALCVPEGSLPAARVHGLRPPIPPLTRGEGTMEPVFDHYQPVRGPVPARPRTDDNPLNRDEYPSRVTRRS